VFRRFRRRRAKALRGCSVKQAPPLQDFAEAGPGVGDLGGRAGGKAAAELPHSIHALAICGPGISRGGRGGILGR